MFQFENLDAFMSMGGHGPYVWGSYGLSLVIMGWLALAPLRRQRVLLTKLHQRLQAKDRRMQDERNEGS